MSFRNVGLDELLPPFLESRARFVRFAIVGATGVVVNLGAMTCLVLLMDIKDWRASALATFLAMVSNYLLNNLWTFRDRAHQGPRLVTGCLRYVSFSLVGMGLTTGTFTVLCGGLSRNLHQSVTALPYQLLLLAQLAGVAVGTVSNYILNKTFTWRQPTTEL